MGDSDGGQILVQEHEGSCPDETKNAALSLEPPDVSADGSELEAGGATTQVCREKTNCPNNNEIAMNNGHSSTVHTEPVNCKQEGHAECTAQEMDRDSIGDDLGIGHEKEGLTDNVCESEGLESQVLSEATNEKPHVTDVVEEDLTEHVEQSISDDTNKMDNANQDSIQNIQNVEERTTQNGEESVDHKESSNCKSNVFSERISSDGSSVEIAEEAEECKASDADSNAKSLDSCREGDEHLSIQHSRDVLTSSPVAMGTGDAADVQTSSSSSPNTNCQNSLMNATEEITHRDVPSASADPGAVTNSDRSEIVNAGGNMNKRADESYDRLMSELAAELEEPVSPRSDLPEGAINSSHSQEESKKAAEEKSKLAKLADEWKKKYCHVEAELQR